MTQGKSAWSGFMKKSFDFIKQAAAYEMNAQSRAKPADKADITSPILLDTSLGTRNAGDAIIMYYAERQLGRLFSLNGIPRLPVHGGSVRANFPLKGHIKILCGTNALNTHMNRYHSIALPMNREAYANSLLLFAVGLGIDANQVDFNSFTSRFLKNILTTDYVHSVRDEHTKEALSKIGIDKVENTSCVTMWGLTESFCATIPTCKHKSVLTTITDYGFDPDLDGYMLSTLLKHYENVYLWVQGSDDERCVKSLGSLASKVQLIHGGLQGLEQFVDGHADFDYFGTRLHCGIFCLNHGIRSRIVSIDNRAADIATDTNLPVVQRSDLRDRMVDLIERDSVFDIHIPTKAIERWKSQFAR